MKKRIKLYMLAFTCILMTGLVTHGAQAEPCELPEFDSDNFLTHMDNPYLPQPPTGGITYVYEAEEEDGIIRNYIYFSNDTKEISGVECIVVYDVEWLLPEDGDKILLEYTQDWHAWDKDGNFWYFGEYTTEIEYDDEGKPEVNHEGSWEAGVDGALPGIILPAEPEPGDCYQQEYYEDEAEDVGKVLRLNAKASTPLYDYEDCMVMKEWTALDPGNVEHKYYAPGDGLVYVQELKEKTVEVELVEILPGSIPGDFDPPWE